MTHNKGIWDPKPRGTNLKSFTDSGAAQSPFAYLCLVGGLGVCRKNIPCIVLFSISACSLLIPNKFDMLQTRAVPIIRWQHVQTGSIDVLQELGLWVWNLTRVHIVGMANNQGKSQQL